VIAIVDYNVGNLHNLKNALDYQNLPNVFVRGPEGLEAFDHIILPGVGAFKPAIDHLRQAELESAVKERVAAGVPFLGVCIGMQLLFDLSEEDGMHQGLGLIKGRVVRFAHDLKIPQIGWNTVRIQRADPILDGIPNDSYFYFVHSYHPVLDDPRHALGWTEYGELFPAIVAKGNVWGVQFHPEKSQNAGLRLLKNFATIQPA
jgi:glutamine amidotransferase